MYIQYLQIKQKCKGQKCIHFRKHWA